MKKNFLLLFFISFYVLFADAQDFSKTANDAFIITRMATKFHVQPRAVDKSFSSDVFNKILDELDDDNTLFTQDDYEKLQTYQFILDNEIKQRKTNFLQLLFSIYNLRIAQQDTMVDNICKNSFNYNLPEKYSYITDSIRPANIAEMHNKIYKRLKLSVLNELLDSSNNLSVSSSLHNAHFDTLEIFYRKKEGQTFKIYLQAIMQSSAGIAQQIGNAYCKSIALCYDPHTEYFPPTEKENFETELGNTSYVFGIGVDGKNKNQIVIDKLEPGSPAFKSGLMNKGDQIISIKWEGKQPINVSDGSPEFFSSLISQNNHDKLTFTIKKPDNSIREVTLVKAKEETTDDEKVKGFLLKGKQTIGYISLPDFYTGWEGNGENNKGCASDVAIEILKLKEENIDGLIIDLRYNGGGVVQEAVELAGIFIDAGPVQQIQENNGKLFSLKDMNRGTVYDGPLLILVNGYSASASEMFAGAMQDYNRALIVGSPTYGKATMQAIFPMDTTINPEDEKSIQETTSSYLKLTEGKLFRISGATAQRTGVTPNIILPDMLGLNADKEADEKLALNILPVDANKYYKPYPPLPINTLKNIAQSEMENDNFFKALNRYIDMYKAELEEKETSLNWKEAYTENKKDEEQASAYLQKIKDSATNFIVSINNYEKKLIANDDDLKAVDDEILNYISHDAYIKISYDLLGALQKN